MDTSFHQFQLQQIPLISREIALEGYIAQFNLLLVNGHFPDLDWLRRSSRSHASVFNSYEPVFEKMSLTQFIASNEETLAAIRWPSQATAHLQDPNLRKLVEHVSINDIGLLISLNPESPDFETAVLDQILNCRFDDHPNLLDWLFAVADQPLPKIVDKEGLLDFLSKFLLARRQNGTGSCLCRCLDFADETLRESGYPETAVQLFRLLSELHSDYKSRLNLCQFPQTFLQNRTNGSPTTSFL